MLGPRTRWTRFALFCEVDSLLLSRLVVWHGLKVDRFEADWSCTTSSRPTFTPMDNRDLPSINSVSPAKSKSVVRLL